MSKQRDYQKRMKAAGRCTQCGGSLGRGKLLCNECMDIRATECRRRVRKRNLAGKCARCRTPLDGKSKFLCTKCGAKQTKYMAKRRELPVITFSPDGITPDQLIQLASDSFLHRIDRV